MGDYQKEFFSHIFGGVAALVLDHILLNSPNRGITEAELTIRAGVPIYVLPTILKKMLNWEIIMLKPDQTAPHEETKYVLNAKSPMGDLIGEIDDIWSKTPKMAS